VARTKPRPPSLLSKYSWGNSDTFQLLETSPHHGKAVDQAGKASNVNANDALKTTSFDMLPIVFPRWWLGAIP
jgi:hypothetical protein